MFPAVEARTVVLIPPIRVAGGRRAVLLQTLAVRIGAVGIVRIAVIVAVGILEAVMILAHGILAAGGMMAGAGTPGAMILARGETDSFLRLHLWLNVPLA